MTGRVVAVTGASGFLGSHVARQLAGRGATVRAMVQDARLAANWHTPGVTAVVADLLDPESLRQFLRGVEIVFHCAARVPGTGDANAIWQVNVNGTQNLLDACADAGVGRFVFVSSDSVYGDGHLASANELTPLNPQYLHEDNYPASKLAGEELVMKRHKEGALVATIVRPCLMYGPGESTGTTLLRRMASRSMHRIYHGGRARWSLGYVEGQALATILAGITPAAAGQIYNISDGAPHTMLEMVTELSHATGRRVPVVRVPAALWSCACRVIHPVARRVSAPIAERFDPEVFDFICRDHVMNIDKARRELGYQPSVTLDEGLRRMFAWLADPRSIL